MPKILTKTLEFEHYDSLEGLSPQDQQLALKARSACENAYAPYSNFRVGAALLLENGQIILGSNQENAAYPSGLCAERVAFFASAVNFPNVPILKVAVVAIRTGSDTYQEASPCGGCRQVMVEYEYKQQKPIELILHWGENGYLKASSMADLLPMSFTADSLLLKM